MSCLRYVCLFAYCGVLHILCFSSYCGVLHILCFSSYCGVLHILCFLRLVYAMLPVSLDCPIIVIAPLILSNVYLVVWFYMPIQLFMYEMITRGNI